MKALIRLAMLLSVLTPVTIQAQGGASLPINPPVLSAIGTPIVLNWADNSDNEVEFDIYRRSDSTAPWVKIARAHWNEMTYTDWQSTSGHYCYQVTAVNFAGESTGSNEACTDFVAMAPTAPVLTLSTLPLSSTLKMPIVSWQANSNAMGIHIDRKDPSKSYAYQPDVDVSSGIYHDHRVVVDRKWCYRARFYNAVGDGPYTEICFP